MSTFTGSTVPPLQISRHSGLQGLEVQIGRLHCQLLSEKILVDMIYRLCIHAPTQHTYTT